MKASPFLLANALLFALVLVLSACTPVTEPNNQEAVIPPVATEPNLPQIGDEAASGLKEFSDENMNLFYPEDWDYSKEGEETLIHAFFLGSENQNENKFLILPQGGYDHGLPFGPGEIDEDTVIGGKKAHKTVWKNEANQAIGYIKFLELPKGWSEYNRIEFIIPYEKLDEVNQVLNSIQFN